MRLLEEKVTDYRAILRDLVALPEIVAQLRAIHAELDSVAAGLSELVDKEAALRSSVNGASSSRLADLFNRHTAMRLKRDELQNRNVVLRAEQKSLAESRRQLRVRLDDLKLWSSDHVLEASSALALALDSEEAPETVATLAERVEISLRSDLLEP
jgi:uncharacterized coiled-coil DUF342 family protein